MEEKQRFEEGHRLCANNCGFFGSPATLDASTSAPSATAITVSRRKSGGGRFRILPPVRSRPISHPNSSATRPNTSATRAAISAVADQVEEVERKEDRAAAGPRRCASCRKRVELTGFQCRCGTTYCGAHRYTEQHGCSFDLKATGRAAIAQANPVVKADKLRKI